jgi:hypothetical protein
LKNIEKVFNEHRLLFVLAVEDFGLRNPQRSYQKTVCSRKGAQII